ncbi:MAG: GMC family oxidoreductase, partial [Gaiellales bacterium]
RDRMSGSPERFDVVVVGAGSAGSAVASRLSEREDRTVLLLEAGRDFPDEETNPPSFFTGGNALGHDFAGIGAPTPELDWEYYGEPLGDGRRVHHRRGKLVGGSSMINGTIAVRAAPLDFDRWREHGAPEWGWEDVKDFIARVETVTPIKRYARRHWHPFAAAFVAAHEEIGYRYVDDLNEPDSWDGIVGQWPQNRRNEVRQGTLLTYVRRARGRPNFELRARCLADRVVIENGRATGVRYLDGAGEPHTVHAELVVLSGGAYGSPAVLMRSGVGPAEALAEIGIDVTVNLPVGRGMMEHPQCFFHVVGPPELAEMAYPGWPVASRGRGNHWYSFPLALDEEAGLCAVAFALARDAGEGTVRLVSDDPTTAPRIDHRLQAVIESDRFDHAWETFRQLLGSAALRKLGASSPDLGRELREVLQERLGTAFHPAGGCQIGRVVDDALRVHGVDGLRVADASVFPVHIMNNPNLTCMMLGERVADMCST